MKRTARRAFKALFKEQKMVSLTDICTKCEISAASPNKMAEILKKWKMNDLFEVSDDKVLRTDIPYPWEKMKRNLKKGGKWALTKAVPVAIGLATGGAGLGVALGPVLGDVINKFKTLGLDVRGDSEEELKKLFSNNADASIEILMDKLKENNSAVGLDSETLERKLRLSIKEFVHPYLAEIKAIFQELNTRQEHLSEIFDDWMEEQRERTARIQDTADEGFALTQDMLEELGKTLGEDIDRFEAKLDSIQEGVNTISAEVITVRENIEKTGAQLIGMEEKFENLMGLLCAKPLGTFSLQDLQRLSRLQFENISLSGKFDRAFVEEEFIPTTVLDGTFDVFIWEERIEPIFLLVAKMGMGKTWNAAHLGLKAIREGSAITFFIPLQYGYRQEMRRIFPATLNTTGIVDDVVRQCSAIKRKHLKPVLFIFDGLDEIHYSDDEARSFLQFLGRLLSHSDCNCSIKVLLTDRIEDWQTSGVYLDEPGRFICQNPHFSRIQQERRLPSGVSYYLEGFSDEQLDSAIVKYGLSILEFKNRPSLYSLSHSPYILGLILYHQLYPDPDNSKEFYPFFYKQNRMEESILKRMNLNDTQALQLIATLLRKFNDVDGTLSFIDISQIKGNFTPLCWTTLELSGLLVEEGSLFNKVYSFKKEFRPVLHEFGVRNGIFEKKSGVRGEKIDTGLTVNDLPPPNLEGNTRAEEFIEKRKEPQERYLQLEKMAIDENKVEEALKGLQEELDKAEKRLDDRAESEITKAIARVKNYKERAYDLIPSARNAEKNRDFENAYLQWKEICTISKEHGWEKSQTYSQKRQDKCAQLVKENIKSHLNEVSHKLEKGELESSLTEAQSILEKARKFGFGELVNKANQLIEEGKKQITLIKIGEKNNTIVSEAKKTLQEKKFDKAISLFEESKTICTEQQWQDGINYAQEMIAQANDEKEKFIQAQQTYSQLIEKAAAELENTRIDEAEISLNNASQLSNKYGISTEKESNLKNILKLQKLSRTGKNAVEQKKWPEARKVFEQLLAESTSLGWDQWVRYAEDELKKVKENSIVMYNALKPSEAKFLLEIEKLIGGKNIPHVDKIEWNTFGFKAEGNSVVGLGLYKKGLTTLPESIGQLTNLQTLYLQGNKITTLPESIGQLKNLQTLSLLSNKLTTLPESVGQLTDLQRLSLKGNQLSTLPESIGQLTNLQTLSLWGNKLTTLPESIGKLKNLKELILYKNQLSTLPASIGNLKSLQTLDLYYNQLSTLPESIGQLKNLKRLLIKENRITTLPESLELWIKKLKENGCYVDSILL